SMQAFRFQGFYVCASARRQLSDARPDPALQHWREARLTGCRGQGCSRILLLFMPGIVAADDVYDVLVADFQEQAARDGAAVSTLAVNGDGTLLAEMREGLGEAVEGIPLGRFHVAGLPFRFAAHIQHAHAAAQQFFLELAHGYLCKLRQRSPACYHPSKPFSRYPETLSIPTRASRMRDSAIFSAFSATRMGRQCNPKSAPAQEANCPESAMWMEPGTWPAANASEERVSRTMAPCSS